MTEQADQCFVVAITEEKTKPDEPRTIVATQLPNVYSLPDDVEVSAEAYPKINWSYGPVKVLGYVNPKKFAIRVQVSVFGAKLLNLTGDLRRGICAKINIKFAKGSICFFLKNGKEVWVKLDLKATVGGHYKKEAKLLTL
ncbi:uncharacterized protein BO66DRAFT_430538 [Aspergillus aculeatinus CBS 121060]|uniref:Uncharacterized protein n=1 Tax=Aspergillus aculeatinus CBS 121060 TaxID=1448322 RepID=A0ACD1H2D2_9EURO|nr:hypothetical protein BO66DRAFT_430538 [Aspergillus aculeatinus CBS 121060]RAH67548.1 hypothetical protein BO66DRAFT_430538 [Aspergillus aculeatinus CBS 121060]